MSSGSRSSRLRTEEAEEVCQHIRTVIRKLSSAKTARATSILYGGSMNGDNAAQLLAQPDIDGGLIGGGAGQKSRNKVGEFLSPTASPFLLVQKRLDKRHA